MSQQQWTRWQEHGLYIFFLTLYCSEMNLIECEWHQLKSHEISGQIFDNEYDLALAIISGMNSRSSDGDYAIKRFIFNCAYSLPSVRIGREQKEKNGSTRKTEK